MTQWMIPRRRHSPVFTAARRCALALVAVSGLAFGTGCDTPKTTPRGTPTNKLTPANETEAPFLDEKRVKDLLLTQASAWNHGDLPGFCSAYAEDALFLSPSGVTQGRAQILARYQKRYGKAADTMGSLTLVVLEVRGSGNAASVAMKWSLSWDPSQKKEPASGLSLITLHKVTATGSGGGKEKVWRIQQDASM